MISVVRGKPLPGSTFQSPLTYIITVSLVVYEQIIDGVGLRHGCYSLLFLVLPGR